MMAVDAAVVAAVKPPHTIPAFTILGNHKPMLTAFCEIKRRISHDLTNQPSNTAAPTMARDPQYFDRTSWPELVEPFWTPPGSAELCMGLMWEKIFTSLACSARASINTDTIPKNITTHQITSATNKWTHANSKRPISCRSAWSQGLSRGHALMVYHRLRDPAANRAIQLHMITPRSPVLSAAPPSTPAAGRP